MKIKFVILGEPKSKGRPRFSRAGSFVRTYTPETTVSYENLVKIEFARQHGDIKFEEKTPLDLRIAAYFSIPKSTSKKKREQMLNCQIRPTKKPDMDNILKIIADSLNKIAYHDDSQIVDSMVRKFYSDNPRVEVTIQSI